MRRRTLARQMTLYAIVLVVITVILTFVVTYVVYVYLIDPNQVPDDDDAIVTSADLLWMSLAILVGLIVATPTALRLARRIVRPLDSLATAIQSAAQGDLGARAVVDSDAFGETSGLLEDYNHLVARLEKTSAEKIEWNAAIAHELRTPVAILRGRLKGLAEGVFTPSEELFLNLLHHVEGLSRMIDDLRALSLSESGHLHLQKTEVRLDIELRQVLGFIEPTLKNHRLVVDLAPIAVHCDPVRVRQAVLAILDNASRYATPGVVRVTLAGSATTATIAVEDTGPGIPDDFRELVFDAFSRRDESRSRSSGGSGLGLAVVRTIAIAHHGTVECLPSELGGTCFRISIPTKAL